MKILLDAAAERRLDGYVSGIGSLLKNEAQRASFATYTMGLLGDGERKSIEPIAARACPDPAHVPAMEAKLGHFLTNAKWSDARIRTYAAEHAIAAMCAHGPILHTIVDDTGIIKQGTHSVGVARQYTGSAGKVTNCQVAVTLTVATRTAHLPIDIELYLPKEWANDSKRRAEARIPADVQFETKPQLALKMLKRAKANNLPLGVVLVDGAYGDSSDFRSGLRQLGLDYAVAIHGPSKVWRLDRAERIYDAAIRAKELAAEVAKKREFRRCTWREGTRGKLSARFACVRVASAYDDKDIEPSVREALWLVMEWPEGENAPTKYYLSNLPANVARRTLVRTIKERYRVERSYEDLKGELGFDHYEGRRWPGWHHHMSCVLACFAFIVADHERRFPPSAGWAQEHDSLARAA